MKILSATLENNVINITLDQEVEVTKIYLDSIINESNMYSQKDEDHEKVLLEHNGLTSEISIELTDWLPYKGGVIITVNSNDESSIAFTIDKKYFYNLFIAHLTVCCNTCQDIHRIHKLLMINLRYNILCYAIEEELLEDALKHFKDIIRLV